MFSALRTRYGIPGILATVALVFAMTGGAFAAKYLITSTKQISPSVLKKLKGAAGPAGAPGAAGAQGPAGAAGAAGKDGAVGPTGATGTSGTNGKSVLNGSGTPTAGVGGVGDFYIDTTATEIYGPKQASGPNSGWGSPTALKGPQGDPWTAGGTLPDGETLSGWWFVNTETGAPVVFGVVPMAISFNIPLASAPAAIEFAPEGGNATCTGSVGAPTAPDNTLCFYKQVVKGLAYAGPIGANASGTMVAFSPAPELEPKEPGFAFGTWAVTG